MSTILRASSASITTSLNVVTKTASAVSSLVNAASTGADILNMSARKYKTVYAADQSRSLAAKETAAEEAHTQVMSEIIATAVEHETKLKERFAADPVFAKAYAEKAKKVAAHLQTFQATLNTDPSTKE